MGSLIFILAPILGVMGLATGFAIALGVVAARADAHCDHMLAEEQMLERAGAATEMTGADGAQRYALPPPEVATAMAAAATTSTAVTTMTRRSPATSLGKLGRRSPIPSDTSRAHPTSRPPAM
jgi:hypothetical protein